MPKNPYRVEGVSSCGAIYTIYAGKSGREAFKAAERTRLITGKRPTIYFNNRKQAY